MCKIKLQTTNGKYIFNKMSGMLGYCPCIKDSQRNLDKFIIQIEKNRAQDLKRQYTKEILNAPKIFNVTSNQRNVNLKQ